MEERKIKLSNKIYPIFYGFSADLMFWIAINTLFLTVVKHLNASQINTINFVGTLVAIVIQLFSIKFIRKIGNINSVKLGTIMLFLAALIFTVSTKYYMFFIAQILYSCGFIFKQMDNVVLIKNLKYLNKSEEYIKYQAKGSFIYSLTTLIISIFSGLLFNINNYIPMLFCLTICFINIIVSNFFYEVKIKNETINENSNFKFSKLLFLIIVLYGLFYASVSVGQTNSKLFIQYDMSKFLNTERVAIYFSIVISISRVARTVADMLFIRIYNKMKDNIIILLETGLLATFVLMLTGHFIGNGMRGIIIMALGFFIFLAIRDPFDNYMRKICFDNCEVQNHDRAIVYLSLSRKIGEVLFSGIIAMILTRFNYVYAMTFMLIMSFMYIFFITKIRRLLKI